MRHNLGQIQLKHIKLIVFVGLLLQQIKVKRIIAASEVYYLLGLVGCKSYSKVSDKKIAIPRIRCNPPPPTLRLYNESALRNEIQSPEWLGGLAPSADCYLWRESTEPKCTMLVQEPSDHHVNNIESHPIPSVDQNIFLELAFHKLVHELIFHVPLVDGRSVSFNDNYKP